MEIKNGFTKNKKIIWLMCALALCLPNVAHAMYKYAKAKQTHFDHTKIKNAFIEKSKMNRLELARVVAAAEKEAAREVTKMKKEELDRLMAAAAKEAEKEAAKEAEKEAAKEAEKEAAKEAEKEAAKEVEKIRKLKLEAVIKDKTKECGKDYFIYQQETANGICVAPDVLKLSRTLNNMTGDIAEGGGDKAIPLSFPIEDIEDTFTILKLYQEKNEEKMLQIISNYPLGRLISIANAMIVLDCPDVIGSFLGAIKNKNIDQLINNQEFKRLNIDLQKQLMVELTVNKLEELIIKRYEKDRKHVLISSRLDIDSIAFDSNSKNLAAGGRPRFCENFVYWERGKQAIRMSLTINISAMAFSRDGNNIILAGDNENVGIHSIYSVVNRSFSNTFGDQGYIKSIVLIPSNSAIVVGKMIDQNNLQIKNINNGSLILNLVGHSSFVNSVAMSLDGKIIVSGSNGKENNLILWDMSAVDWSNPQQDQIIQKIVINECDGISSLAMSADGSKLITGSLDGRLILWNMNNQENVTNQELVHYSVPVNAVAVSRDDKHILVGLAEGKNNVELLDIGRNNINRKVFDSGIKSIKSVAFGDKDILFGGESFERNYPSLVTWTLWNDEEEKILNDLKRYNVEQIRLIYWLCLSGLKNVAKLKQDTPEYVLFKTLPENMQKLLTDLRIVKIPGALSRWWYEK